jgi:hypothetical protein
MISFGMASAQQKHFFFCYIFPNSLATAIENLHPDIIHLHWIAGNLYQSNCTPKNFQAIYPNSVGHYMTRGAFTGGCHFLEIAINGKTQCNACPIFRPPFPP